MDHITEIMDIAGNKSQIYIMGHAQAIEVEHTRKEVLVLIEEAIK
jgi:hypothetical protein